MLTHPLWSDEYWLLLLQLYLHKPEGIKPMYSRGLVNISIELHIPPQFLYKQMFVLRQLDIPRIEQLWKKYGKSPKKLSKGIAILRRMNGFNDADEFYRDVEMCESFEKDFKPLEERKELTPVMLIMILDLYFRLTPITMVTDTPEVMELAKMMKIKPETVAEVMTVFQYCDPYLHHDDIIIDPLLAPCQSVWQRFGNDYPEDLSALAAQLKEYFK